MLRSSDLLCNLPRIDDLLEHPVLSEFRSRSPVAARDAARQAVDEFRNKILADDLSTDIEIETIAARAAEICRAGTRRSLQRAVNATGVILHTNLGRAPLSPDAVEAITDVASGYCNVQAGLDSGERMPRETHVQDLFKKITGAESCLVVNNNAAATILVLNTLAAGREVILSRGEMVEIGGSFRIPEIMQLSGCKLVEVGCTNRTHLRDYENAITPATSLILSVHQSNYRIEGFASQTPISPLAGLARSRNIACVHDLGSGALLDLRQYNLPYEPNVPESLAAGVDAALFSGDKLLGGPQCGIILGKESILQRMRKNPYYRAFRVCKLTLSALEATLRLFTDLGQLPARHRVLGMLTMPLPAIRARADALASSLNESCPWLRADVVESFSQVGGGSLAGHNIPTFAVRVTVPGLSADDLSRQLRLGRPPVFVRIHDDYNLLDPRTIIPGEEEAIISSFCALKDGSS